MAESGDNEENRIQDTRTPTSNKGILKYQRYTDTDEGKENLHYRAFYKKFNLGLVYAVATSAQTVTLTALTIAANVAPDLKLPGIFWEGHKLSDLAIVEKIYLLNFAFLLVLLMTIGSISLFLIEKRRLYEIIQAGKDFETLLTAGNENSLTHLKTKSVYLKNKSIYFRDH